MKGLFLYGLNCQPWIWDEIKKDLTEFEIDYVEYPREITRQCKSVADLSKWVYETYLFDNQKYDFILGHSMGGIIALYLSSLPDVHFDKTIIVEAFLKPVEPFYRNLMTDANIVALGEKVFAMLKEEDGGYTNELKTSLKENYDYSEYLTSDTNIYVIYGDRGNPEYQNLLCDLNLKNEQLGKINISFINNSCHLPMLENPNDLATRIKSILS